jgi:hypothetical protein
MAAVQAGTRGLSAQPVPSGNGMAEGFRTIGDRTGDKTVQAPWWAWLGGIRDGVRTAGRVSQRTGSGVPAVAPSITHSLIGEARPEGGAIRADGVKSPSQRPGLLAWQSGKGGLVECFPPSTTPKYCYLPEGVSLPRLIFIE